MTLPQGRRGEDDEEEGGSSPPPSPPNPFIHRVELTLVDKLKVGLMSLTVFPLRVLLVILLVLLAWPLTAAACSLRRRRRRSSSDDDASDAAAEPRFRRWWRRLLEACVRGVMRAVWFCMGFHRIGVHGRRAAAREAPVLVLAPHSTFFDCVPVAVAGGSVVAKRDCQGIPVLGTILGFLRPVFVSRGDRDSRRRTVDEIKRRVDLLVGGGSIPQQQIMIFPEATCTNRRGLIRFKAGAFIPGVPVQPVLLRYPSGGGPDTVTWTWRGPGMLAVLWLTLCQLDNRVEMEYLPVYVPSEEERADPALYADNVRRTMARALRVPLADASVEDCHRTTQSSAASGGPAPPLPTEPDRLLDRKKQE